MPAAGNNEIKAQFEAADRYMGGLFVTNPALHAAAAASDEAGLPAIAVSPLQGQFLHVLALALRARRVLEVGTLGAYSTICLASALPADGVVVTLELEPRHAEVARANLSRAGLADRVELRVGPAADSLEALVREGVDPFDLVFLDADKANNARYLARALELAHRGTVVVVDNVVRGGRVADAESRDTDVVGSRQVLEAMAAEKRLSSSALQVVGVKGYDGFAIGVVRD